MALDWLVTAPLLYIWIVVHDFQPHFIGVRRLLRNHKHLTVIHFSGQATIPLSRQRAGASRARA